jgi:hypothetical protein
VGRVAAVRDGAVPVGVGRVAAVRDGAVPVGVGRAPQFNVLVEEVVAFEICVNWLGPVQNPTGPAK